MATGKGKKMKRVLVLVAVLGISAALVAPSAMAGDAIRKACLKAGRPAASRALCGCIQSVADQSLNRRDQRLAATFFKDPHKAQVIRQSDRASHEAFWLRYKAFGSQAEETCTSGDG